MVALVEQIESDIAPIEVAVFNIGANVRFGITETTARAYHKVWEMAAAADTARRRLSGRMLVSRQTTGFSARFPAT